MNNNSTLTVLAVLAAGITTSDATSVILDGIYTGEDGYTNSATVTWYNGHQTNNSIYGNFDNQVYTTTIRWGVAKEASDLLGDDYFFLHVEAPLYAKNMIWGQGLLESDIAPYRVHHETHHSPGDLDLDFNTATGSEKLVFVDSDGDDVFKADLAGNADNDYNLVGYKDSSDYLLDNALATEQSSLNRTTKMSFEFQFALNQNGSADAEVLVLLAQNGIELHLSPERGLVPEPSTTFLFGVSSALLLMRRRRQS